MSYQINYAYTCHTGKVRRNNEDNFWCCGDLLPASNNGMEEIHTGTCPREKLPTLAVFDGMGGESQGENFIRTGKGSFAEIRSCFSRKPVR